MDRDQLLVLYRNMLLARGIDRIEQELTSRGKLFFTCLVQVMRVLLSLPII